jgi:hypothetical protein
VTKPLILGLPVCSRTRWWCSWTEVKLSNIACVSGHVVTSHRRSNLKFKLPFSICLLLLLYLAVIARRTIPAASGQAVLFLSQKTSSFPDLSENLPRSLPCSFFDCWMNVKEITFGELRGMKGRCLLGKFTGIHLEIGS